MEKPVYMSSVPEPLTFYKGGLNLGIFYPGPPIYSSGSVIFGNEFTGKPRNYKAYGGANGFDPYSGGGLDPGSAGIPTGEISPTGLAINTSVDPYPNNGLDPGSAGLPSGEVSPTGLATNSTNSYPNGGLDPGSAGLPSGEISPTGLGINTTYSSYPTGGVDPNEGYAWALILAPKDMNQFLLRKTSESVYRKQTSVYDGYFNKFQTTKDQLNRLNSFKMGGYTDWYIPSRDELAFIAKNLPQGFNLAGRFTSLQKTTYISSTYNGQNLTGKNGKKFSLVISQSFNPSTYGDTRLVSDNKPMNVRFVRRVPVYII
jgi:hypothetical protein